MIQMSDLIDKAIFYATMKHKNVNRKGSKIPYIIHPLEAMSIAATMTDDEEIIAATALHDVIEDTDTTYDDIKNEFGKRVADLVAHESKNLLDGYSKDLSWYEVKKLELNHLIKCDKDTKIVTLSDKLSNMRNIHNDYYLNGDDFWNRFNEKNPNLHKWRFYELLKCFDELKDTMAYMEFEQLVKDTFKDVK